MFSLLQLSDLHFGASHHFRQTPNDPASRTLAQAVAHALKRYNQPAEFDCLILSGDLLSNDAPRDSVYAGDMLTELLATIKVPPSRVLCVPGNHDLSWDSSFGNSFRFYDEIAKKIGAQCARSELPQVIAITPAVSGRKGLAIILLDSCVVEGQKMAGYGRVGSEQLDKMDQAIAKARVSPETHTLIAVLHHHLLPISPEEKLYNKDSPKGDPTYRPSITTDAVEIIRRLGEAGVSMILHGHQHQSRVVKYRNFTFGGKPVYVIAAGSCGASQTKTGEHFRRSFFLHKIDDSSAFVIPFDQSEQNDDQFDQSKAFQLPLPGSGGASLDDSPMVLVGGERTKEVVDAAKSDLNLMLLSVVDCPEARRVIRSFFVNFSDSDDSKRLHPTLLRLVSMHDLLGRWDLAVRFRLDRNVDPKQFGSLLQAELIQRKLLSPETEGRGGYFALSDLLVVERELASLDQLKATGQIEIARTWLGKTDEYEQKLCQRGFVFIDVAPENRTMLLQDLRAQLASDKRAASIIESVLITERAVVIEVFMSLSQLLDIGRLNRVIEPALTPCRSQKYTLLCYAYDEQTIGLDRETSRRAERDFDAVEKSSGVSTQN